MAGLGLIILTFICTDTAGAAVRPVVSFSPNWTPIFPGESVTLSCNVAPTAQGNLGYSWYRDGERIRRDEQNLTGVTDSGDYQCQAGASERSDPVTLDVSAELFSPPHINVSPYDLIEGDHMTITCDTELRPHRETTELQFAFYRNGHNVQGFSLSNQYGVPSAQLEDSGNYTCEVQTPTGSVRKRSSVVTIHIQGAAARPVLSVSPNWAPILTGDSVNLTCNGARPAQGNESYTWYRGNSQRTGVERQTYVIHRARREQSGRYQCQIDAGDRSAAFQLTVSDEKLILQAPPGVHEGDELILRCHHPPDYRTSDTTFEFREEPINRSLGSDSVLPLGKAQANMSGPYRCKTKLYDKFHDITHNYTSPVEHLSVTELFSPPQIKVRPDQVTEGDHMTITCDTELRPHRETTELQIAFYRNGHNVQGFNSSNQYGVPSAQLEDSGKYTCEVQTPTGSVRKRSSMVHIHIQELFSYPQINVSSDQVTEGDHMTITCGTELRPHRETTELQFAFYRNGHNVQGFSLSNQYEVPSAQLEDSGNYTCEVQTPTGSVRKRSSMAHIHIQELFNNTQIKVSSDQVTEGDHMTITCDTKLSPHRETTELLFAFYRNGHNVQGFSSSNQYGVPSAQLEDSGNYTCEVQTPTGSVRKRSNVLYIHIQELFSTPQIKVRPNPAREGDHMIITCDTELSPHRETTELQFAFYRNGHNEQRFSLYNKYGVPSAQLEDSGNYTCEVQTPTGSVRKRSSMVHIHIQALLTKPQIILSSKPLAEGDEMTITCDPNLGNIRNSTELQFAFFKNGLIVQGFNDSSNYTVPSAQLEESGNYTCEVKKRSSVSQIQVEELFSTPQIKVRPDQVTQGDHMTITCDTKLRPHRETTELQFAFYRNGHNVQGFSLSNQYGVPSAQLEDSGNYTCEVQTPTGSVRKRSKVSHIEIQGAVESQDGGTTDSPPYLNKSKKEAASGDAKSAKRIPTQTNETMGDPGASHEGRTNATGVSSQMRETKEDTEQPGASLPSRGKETSSQLHFQLGERSQMYLALGLIGSVLALLVVAAAFVIKTRQKRSSWLIQHLQRLKTVHSRIPKVKMSSTPILVSFVPEEPRYTELPSQGTTEHLNQKRHFLAHHQNNNDQSAGRVPIFGQKNEFSDLTNDETAILKQHFPGSNSIPSSNGYSVGESYP
uniref:Ig-like domain-containing protein n=1 Tax=Xenopus tropicalis TaxID=8364 RepID=A0A803JEM7_XENTR